MMRPRLMPTSPSISSTSGMPSASVRGSAAQMPEASACSRAWAGSPRQGNASATGLAPSSRSAACDARRARPRRRRRHRSRRQARSCRPCTGRFCSGSLSGSADQDGVAADLHRELRGADDGRADALARIPDRRQVAAVRQQVAQAPAARSKPRSPKRRVSRL